jgi:hypothetical protein
MTIERDERQIQKQTQKQKQKQREDSVGVNDAERDKVAVELAMSLFPEIENSYSRYW